MTDAQIVAIIRELGGATISGDWIMRFGRAVAAAPRPVTDAMVDAYLKAQREAVEEADRFGRPNIGGLHTNTVREACRAGIAAALTSQEPQ